MEHRDRYKTNDGEFLGRIEPGGGLYEVMLGHVLPGMYDPETFRKYKLGRRTDEEYVTAIHEDGDCPLWAWTPLVAARQA